MINLILTNAPHKYSPASVFADDISNQCVIATVRKANIPKTKPCIIIKRNMKHFVEQGFFHDLFGYDWEKINLTDDAECM